MKDEKKKNNGPQAQNDTWAGLKCADGVWRDSYISLCATWKQVFPRRISCMLQSDPSHIRAFVACLPLLRWFAACYSFLCFRFSFFVLFRLFFLFFVYSPAFTFFCFFNVFPVVSFNGFSFFFFFLSPFSMFSFFCVLFSLFFFSFLGLFSITDFFLCLFLGFHCFFFFCIGFVHFYISFVGFHCFFFLFLYRTEIFFIHV